MYSVGFITLGGVGAGVGVVIVVDVDAVAEADAPIVHWSMPQSIAKRSCAEEEILICWAQVLRWGVETRQGGHVKSGAAGVGCDSAGQVVLCGNCPEGAGYGLGDVCGCTRGEVVCANVLEWEGLCNLRDWRHVGLAWGDITAHPRLEGSWSPPLSPW